MDENALDVNESELRRLLIWNIKGVTPKQACAIIKIVKDENPEKTMTKWNFLKEAKRVYQHKLHTGDPCCSYCFKHFHSKKQLNEHVAVIHHGKEKQFVCESCQSSFMSTQSLEYHKTVFHSETKEEVKCKVCDAVFSHHISLQRHERIHQEVMPAIKCEECHKTFGRKDSMTKHKQRVHGLLFSVTTHKAIKDILVKRHLLQCKMCKKDFVGDNAQDELENHIIRHCKEFECAPCKKCFGSKDSMKQHMTAHHSDLVEFGCVNCEYKSKYKSNLTKHMERRHPD